MYETREEQNFMFLLIGEANDFGSRWDNRILSRGKSCKTKFYWGLIAQPAAEDGCFKRVGIGRLSDISWLNDAEVTEYALI